jgi:K(+)-stimulated pyrophosphate-energized sodium pump
VVGILGSYGVAWFGIRVNTLRQFADGLCESGGRPYPLYSIPLRAGMSIGMLLISVELLIMLVIILFIPGDYAGPCFIGFAIGESLGAAALRIAGGIFTKIADIGSDLMKIVFKIKEDDARNPGVIADCTGDNAGDSVGPSADGFETYGVTGVALISFILLAVKDPTIQVQLLVWIFVDARHDDRRLGGLVLHQRADREGAVWHGEGDELRASADQPGDHHLGRLGDSDLRRLEADHSVFDHGWDGNTDLWWQLSMIISCGTAAGAIIPEMVKAFTSTNSRHVSEVVTASKEVAPRSTSSRDWSRGNFSAYWLGIGIAVADGDRLLCQSAGAAERLMVAPAVFAFGLVAFGFLGMGPVTIAVDSYGPVTDNAQSVYELSLIEQIPNVKDELQKDFGIDVQLRSGEASARGRTTAPATPSRRPPSRC